MRNGSRLFGFAALAAASLSCGDVVRQGRSPVYLALDSLQAASGGGTVAFGNVLFSDVQRIVVAGGLCSTTNPCPTIFADLGQAGFRILPKDVNGLATPTTNNEVTITRYHVAYRRADGRNTPGVDVPYAFDGAITAVVSVGVAATAGFELVRHVAKEEGPLVQLIISRTIITTLADVTFYGKDRVGNDVSVTGTIQVDFGNFGDG
jgi:hypothetical protein